jgi:signal transduction histidine kinase
MRSEKWLNGAAYATWLVVGLPTIAAIVRGSFDGSRAVIWAAAFAAFGAALFTCLRPCSTVLARRRRGVGLALLAIQTAAGLMMVYLSRNPSMAATLVIVSAQTAALFSTRGAAAWVVTQSALLAIIWVAQFHNWISGVSLAGSFLGFQVFGIAAMSLARSERAAREDLARANAEIIATQSLLAESSRTGERLRISRDLHDTLGHHLTALSLQLDVASRLTSGQAFDHVREAHAITRLLLSDVRDVVSQMRDTSRIDFARVMRTLAGGTRAVQLHLDIPEQLPIDESGQAHALLQCVQEIITNAIRHGEAQNLWIRITARPDGIDLHARDDGRGVSDVTWGHGLTGMRERFEEFSGNIDVGPGAERGFEVRGFLPRTAATS